MPKSVYDPPNTLNEDTSVTCFSQSMIHQHTEWRYKCDMPKSVYDPPNTLNEDTSVTCLSQSMIHPTHWMKIQVTCLFYKSSVLNRTQQINKKYGISFVPADWSLKVWQPMYVEKSFRSNILKSGMSRQTGLSTQLGRSRSISYSEPISVTSCNV